MNSGLNLIRFLLAFNVIAFHIWNSLAMGAGPVAVLAFFFVSGLLITQISQEVYADASRSGAFLLNRFLRIYPQYIAAVLLSLLCVYRYPEVSEHVNGYLRWPVDAAEWAPQFLVMGLYGADVRLLPAAWSLSTEIYYYLLIGLVTGRSRTLALGLLAVSLPVGLLCALGVLPFDFYGHPLGNGFAFAFGSVTYFYRDRVAIRPPVFIIACAAYFLHTYGIPLLFASDLNDANIAASLVPFAVMIVYLLQHDVRPRRAHLLNTLGKLAYPMFLTHWSAGVLVSTLFFGGRDAADAATLWGGAGYFLATLAVVMLLSLLFYQFIDKPVERLRQGVRTRSRAVPVAA